jgi:hypothetical protein
MKGNINIWNIRTRITPERALKIIGYQFGAKFKLVFCAKYDRGLDLGFWEIWQIGDQTELFYTTNPVFYTSGNRFVRRTGTFGNLWFFHLSRPTTVIQDLLVRRQFSLEMVEMAQRQLQELRFVYIYMYISYYSCLSWSLMINKSYITDRPDM